ncbi:MAG: menaquinol oxidoreductase [Syntrophales bacterium]
MEQGGLNRPEGDKEPPDFRENRERLREETLETIRNLQRKFTIELLAAALFLLLSVAALGDFSLFPSLPGQIRAALGKPPSVNMISAVLLLYIFSAIILILSRMMSGSGKYGGIGHVGYLAGFYFFYHFSGKLPENIWAVFAAGVTIFGLESYHLWIYCTEEIAREREVLMLLDGRPDGSKKGEGNG